MNLLFVHQNFPGQFRHLAPALVAAGHHVRAMAIDGPGLPNIELHRYQPNRASSKEIHPWAAEFETKVIRGEACAAAASRLKAQGLNPDLIIANPGWGESLFLKDVWPKARLLALIEFYYAVRGLDYDFDPEFSGRISPATPNCAPRTPTCCSRWTRWTGEFAPPVSSTARCPARITIDSASSSTALTPLWCVPIPPLPSR
jgi:hypothetical protein